MSPRLGCKIHDHIPSCNIICVIVLCRSLRISLRWETSLLSVSIIIVVSNVSGKIAAMKICRTAIGEIYSTKICRVPLLQWPIIRSAVVIAAHAEYYSIICMTHLVTTGAYSVPHRDNPAKMEFVVGSATSTLATCGENCFCGPSLLRYLAYVNVKGKPEQN